MSLVGRELETIVPHPSFSSLLWKPQKSCLQKVRLQDGTLQSVQVPKADTCWQPLLDMLPEPEITLCSVKALKWGDGCYFSMA